MKKTVSSRKKAKAARKFSARPAMVYVEKEKRIVDAPLRKRAEKKLAKRPNRDAPSGIDALKLVHELQVHQIELEMQNEELQRAAAAVDESRARYSDLYDFAPVGYVTLDNIGIVLEANLTIARMMGHERGFLLHKPFQSFVFPEDKNAFLIYSQRLVSSDARTTFDIRLARKDKSVFYAQIASIVFKDTINSGRQFFLSVQDFTKRREAEKALEESEMNYRRLVELAQEGIWAVDAKGLTTFVNPAMAHMLGYAPEAMMGRHLFDFGDKREIEITKQSLERGKRGMAERREMELVHADGSRLHTTMAASPIIGDKGEYLGAIAVITDITDRVQNEELLRVQTKDLVLANKDLEAFGFSVSHDLRNPLHSIGACCAVISKDLDTAMGKDSIAAIQHILKATQRMSRVIADLLALSSIAHKEVSREKINLSAMALEFYQELKSFETQREVEFDIEPDCFADADEGFVRILMENLIRNAWNFTSKTADAHIAFGAQRNDGRTVFFIKDNGAGFDMIDVDKIFKPFNRLHSDKDFKGTGIGLAIAKRIIDKHHGKIWAESEKDKGATFFFRLE